MEIYTKSINEQGRVISAQLKPSGYISTTLSLYIDSEKLFDIPLKLFRDISRQILSSEHENWFGEIKKISKPTKILYEKSIHDILSSQARIEVLYSIIMLVSEISDVENFIKNNNPEFSYDLFFESNYYGKLIRNTKSRIFILSVDYQERIRINSLLKDELFKNNIINICEVSLDDIRKEFYYSPFHISTRKNMSSEAQEIMSYIINSRNKL